MLKIINDLEPFFEDCYRRINIREYARIMKISPPTASNLLAYYNREGLLLKEKYRNYVLFYANKESGEFIDLSRIYWKCMLKPLVSFMEENLADPTIILFGSLSKAEAKPDSDIDLAVLACKKELDMDVFENKLKRRIQIFWFKSIGDIKNSKLANSIIEGYMLRGRSSI